jgi:carbamate kinase
VQDQYNAVVLTCHHIASLILQGWDIVITHGNGPQVGFILLRSEIASSVLHTVPLDLCGADTQGAIGYMIQQCLFNEFNKRGIKKQVVAVVTQTLVDKNDPAFQNPTKPVGPFYDKEKAVEYQAEKGWHMVEDAGRGWRRSVPSPKPRRIIELETIRSLLSQGVVVIAIGGGGIPVTQENGRLKGVEAVIDKDYASALLATGLKVKLFLISTATDKVALNFGRPNQEFLHKTSVPNLKRYLAEGQFPPGNMGPKIEAIISYLEGGGKKGIITSPENICLAIAGKEGTTITN